MLRSIGMVTATAVVGVLITKLLWMLLLPVAGFFLGLLMMVLKFGLIVLLIWLGWSFFRKLTDRPSEA